MGLFANRAHDREQARRNSAWHARLMARVMQVPSRPGARLLFEAMMREAGVA